jgi:lipoate-protein ligase A
VRLAGGHAAAYDGDSLIYEEITPERDVTAGLHDRFGEVAALLADALDELGVDARVGEIPGEYCPGSYTVSAAGRIKLVGTAQRAVRGGALVSAFVLVAGGARLRAALVDVYDALELAWDPATAGALADVAPGISMEDVEEAILAERSGELSQGAVDEETLALARTLVERHRRG